MIAHTFFFLRHFALLCAFTERAGQGVRVQGRGLGLLQVGEGGSLTQSGRGREINSENRALATFRGYHK